MSVNRTVENVYLRQDAVQLTRRHFWKLLGMAVLVYAVTSVLNWLLTKAGDALMLPEITAYTAALESYMTSSRLTSSDPITEALTALFTSPKFLLFNLAYFVIYSLISNGLKLGHALQRMNIGRSGTARVLGVFSRMRYCFKGFRLMLWMGLKITLWMLPGFVITIVGSELSLYGWDTLCTIGILVGLVLMLALSIRALLHYSQSMNLLADEPGRGVRDCVRFSTGLMQNRKWQYFKLGIPAVLKAMGAGITVALAGNLVLFYIGLEENYIASEIVNILIGLSMTYFLLQLSMVSTLFYLKLRKSAADKPRSYWLRDQDTAEKAAAADTNETAKENDHEQPDR